MIDLQHFNSVSPYAALPSTLDGFYEFVTDFGVRYSVGFMFDESIITSGAYQFIMVEQIGVDDAIVGNNLIYGRLYHILRTYIAFLAVREQLVHHLLYKPCDAFKLFIDILHDTHIAIIRIKIEYYVIYVTFFT